MNRIVYILLIFVSISAAAQQTDTLAVDTVERDAAVSYRLFSPLKYQRGVTSHFLSADGDTTSLIDRAIMRVYLMRPDLVTANKSAKPSDDSLSAVIMPIGSVSMVNKVNKLDSHKPVFNEEPLFNDRIDMVVTKPIFWTFSGDYNLQFMQNYISPNWYNSGNSSYALLGTVTLQYDYDNHQRLKWDNKLEMRLGFLTTEADSINKFKTSDDLIRYTTQLSYQAYKKWYYAMQAIVSTQFTKGLKDNDKTVYSDFMSPLNLNLSLGMNYNLDEFHHKLKANILLSPISYKLTYCDRSDIVTRFSIEEGKHAIHDFGALVNVDLTWKPFDNFKWQSRLYTYMAYTQRLDTTPRMFQVEWENTFTFQFNRFISAKLYVYPRFDNTVTKVDNTFWQLKENLSFGFSYSM